MLHVQEFLRNGGTLDDLCLQLGIKECHHPTDPLVILNYNTIDSPRDNPITMECRGLVLEKESWNIVAKSFNRFFNLGELPNITGKFVWDDWFSSYTKEDGSLAILYHYNGSWRINTRGSFADGVVYDAGLTWTQLFWRAMNNSCSQMDIGQLSTDYTYVFELCSPYNKIVRVYPEPIVRLLAIVRTVDGTELPPSMVDFVAGQHHIPRPDKFSFRDINDVERYINKIEVEDPTNEGLVLQDINGLRLKVKNKKYLALHKMCSNGNMFAAKNLLPFILDSDVDELLTYFPEAKERVHKISAIVWEAFNHLKHTFVACRSIDDQKEFALCINKDCKEPFGGILFRMRQKGDLDQYKLWDYFKEAEAQILKVLFKNDKGIPKEINT